MKATGVVEDKYFKVIAVEDNQSADILLYGYIGQDYWWDDDLKEESITDLAFAQTLRELDAKYSRINIRINSPGGSMFHGNAIITAIQNSKAEIHTYNDGLAASMAGDIWLSAKHRHMAKNALLMLHSPSSWAFGSAKVMRQSADLLDKWEHTAIVILAEAASISNEEAKEKFYDYEDHWLTAEEVEELGLISTVEDYEAQDPIVGAEKMTIHDIIKAFAAKGDANAKTYLQEFQKLQDKMVDSITKRTTFTQLLTIPSNIKTDPEMKIEDFKKSVKDGKLDIEEVIKALGDQGYDVTQKEEVPPAPPVTPTAQSPTIDMKAISEAFATATKPMMEKIKTLEDKVQSFGDNPGAGPTMVPSDKDPEGVEEENVLLNAFNTKVLAAAQDNDRINISGSTTVVKKRK